MSTPTKQGRLFMEHKKEHVVYILECNDGTLYTGYTNDLTNRIQMHESGKGAKYTRGRGPFVIKSTTYFSTKQEAMSHEYAVKRWPRSKKLQYIKANQLKEEG